jgi:hypothetical protein
MVSFSANTGLGMGDDLLTRPPCAEFLIITSQRQANSAIRDQEGLDRI